MSVTQFGGVRGILASQQTASGQVTTQRARFRKLFVQHAGGGDEELRFYDLNSAPTGGEPYYSFWAYGKGNFTLEIPDEGVTFQNGIYIVMPAGSYVIATSFFEEF